MYRKVEKTVGRIPVSAELSLYTPPVTPSGDAASKVSTKSDLVEVTNISHLSRDDNVPSSKLLPRDSYAPGFIDPGTGIHQTTGNLEKTKTSIKIAPAEDKTDSTIVGRTSSRSSIFDIDSDKCFGGQPTIEVAAIDGANYPSSELLLDSTSSKTIDSPINSVLEKPHASQTMIEKSVQDKKIVTGAAVNIDMHVTRGVQKTNMNLKKCPSVNNVKKEKIYPKLSDIGDNLNASKQQTTTITVEGIPPITLSYDLADLCEKSETIVPMTSTPIQRGSKRRVPVENSACEEKLKPLVELPKRQANLSSKRRTDHRKKYEKFSFNALRKTAQDTKECNETKVKEIGHKTQESLTSESRLASNTDTNGIIASDIPMATSDTNETHNSNQTNESLNLLNVDSNYSNSVENMNLSCLLDDMLLDECQNATKNLNDDWLESFFT